MNANLSSQRLLLAATALVLAWAPAAMISAPGAQRAAGFVSEAAAQGARTLPATPLPERTLEQIDSARIRG